MERITDTNGGLGRVQSIVKMRVVELNTKNPNNYGKYGVWLNISNNSFLSFGPQFKTKKEATEAMMSAKKKMLSSHNDTLILEQIVGIFNL